MPFSFKPEINQDSSQTAQVLPAASFGASSNLMERAKSQGMSFVEILLFALFGFTVLVVLILLAYKFYLSSQVELKKERLAQYEQEISGLPLEDMRKLSNRLKVANQLVKEHPSVNVAFLILEAGVEHMIIFNKFDLQYSDSTKSYKLSLVGSAPNYKSIAQQVDTFKRKPYSEYIPSLNVDTLVPNLEGGISFSLSMPISVIGLISDNFSILDEGSAKSAIPAQVPVVGTSTVSGVGSMESVIPVMGQ